MVLQSCAVASVAISVSMVFRPSEAQRSRSEHLGMRAQGASIQRGV
jgi:hypothetical protein